MTINSALGTRGIGAKPAFGFAITGPEMHEFVHLHLRADTVVAYTFSTQIDLVATCYTTYRRLAFPLTRFPFQHGTKEGRAVLAKLGALQSADDPLTNHGIV